MTHARHHTAKPHAKLAGGNIGRKPLMSLPVLEAIKAAGSKGADSQEIAVAAGLTRRTVNESCCNLRSRTGLIYSLGGKKRHHVRHFHNEVPMADAEAYMAEIEAKRKAEQKALEAAARKRYKQGQKAKKKGDAEALAAVREEYKRRAEERAEIRRIKAEAVEAARKAARSAPNAMKRTTQRINELADKFRGTASPKERAKEVTIVWPDDVKVTQCKGWTPRFSGIQPQGEIAPQIGRYSTEASGWAAAVTA